MLAGCPDIGRLEVLDLTNNALTAEGVRELWQAAPGLRAERQHEFDPDDDEREWLWEGDAE